MVRSVIHMIFTKHAKLIENCYPRQTSQKGPKPSETSYLIYYASSRPVKLLKVARYLERRVAQDASRKKFTDIEVSLAIWNELLQGCARDVNLFAKGVLSSLEIVLKIGAYESTLAAVQTFSLFCSNYDGTSLGIDSELASLLDTLLTEFSSWSQLSDTSSEINQRMRTLGIKALSSFVTSLSGKSTYAKRYLGFILPALLCNIDIAQLHPTENAKTINLKSLNTMDEDLNELASICLANLLNNTNAANISVISKRLFRYLDETRAWDRHESVIDIIRYILDTMEPRYRFMIINEIIKRIDAESLTPKKHTLTGLLVSLLLNHTLTPGISILELLGALVNYFSECLKSGDMAEELVTIENNLINAIGALAKNIYYVDQITDILSYILGKMKISEKRSEIDGVPASLFRVKMLQCLTAVLDNNKVASASNSIVPRVTFRVISLALPLLKSESLEIRKACGGFLLACVESENIGTSHIPNRKLTINSRLVRRNSNPDLKFRNSIHKILVDCVTKKSAAPVDFAIAYAIFSKMLHRYVFDELILTVPVMFKLQKFNEANVDGDFASRVLLDQLVGLYIRRLGSQLDIAEVVDQAEQVVEKRKLADQWFSLFGDDEDENLSNLSDLSMNDLNAKSLGPADYQSIPLSFHDILRVLNHRVELKRRFTELEKQLTTDNSIFITEDSKKLISRTISSTSRVMHGLIPKFTFPTLHKAEYKSNGIRKPVKFETLKEALKLSWDSINEHDADSSVRRTPSQTTNSKRSQRSTRSDMSTLLKTITTSSSSASSSLVNTPRLSSTSYTQV
ncbi:hypothetical protein K493DRAFT_339205 [Basidiobolus meristosporus CBS 931.73]|uniref:ARM repeat-containing protein n=1 Tax=Basidiobolus meristosporus CBS 931.73 TaxID=1314790 RepID=A0A1Y1Y1F5_9FUNG|nr:hypothetical protein K493DRAFT_339205 [Basidiobolus meristosporus CBS 931.73]|eukprot:ORX91725.1 hypothetical protein K493DRAFT_339205 [Basidiobolus meristosporus CBS 931.73]